jgi:hypothetical protein
MKAPRRGFVATAIAGLIFAFTAHATTRYVDLNCANATSPFMDWTTAATNIQDAIEASVDGDLILVTNGVYAGGGRVMAGDLTNRVALNKALTVQSVNGPFATVIRGIGATNGNSAVRCAWLTNGASLVGFALQAGATRNSGDTNLGCGGGVWCSSSNAMVANCLIVSNTAMFYGSGAYQGTLNNCLISGNGLVGINYGAAHNNNLNSCTVVSNLAYGVASVANLSMLQSVARNCIVYYNAGQNNSGCKLSYCCTTPLASGEDNFANAPQLFVDGHLTSASPCRGAGTNLVTGTDIFGQPWLNPPSVGCAEWQPAPMVTQPQLQLTSDPVGFTIKVSGFAGQPPFTNSWIKDGIPLQDDGHFSSTQTTNLVATGVSLVDAGAYQLIVSNGFGAVTSSVVRLVVHCVDAAGVNPVAPYSTWATAATNIQDAINAALASEVVLVTNGIYATGGKSTDGVITNRVAVDKAILVQSANGPSATTIRGAWDPTSTNGPGAVRCAWLTTNAILSGFTLTGGATRSVTSSPNLTMDGGGVWGASTTASVYNCLLVTNFASYYGGGAYSVTLNRCTLTGNHALGSGTPGAGVASAGSGGGAANCNLKNCLIMSNFSDQSYGGGAQNCKSANCAFVKNRAVLFGTGAYQGTYLNCTFNGNGNTSSSYASYGGAAASASLTNCIVYGNFNIGSGAINYYSCTLSYCDTDPLPSGTGNIDVDPQLLADGVRVAATSPCRGAGTNITSGTDIDGQPWANPPSMGCDEWQPMALVFGQPQIQLGGIPLSATFGGLTISGQAPFFYWWSKDGVVLEDGPLFSSTHNTNLVAMNFGPAHAGGYQLIVSNAFGMVTSVVARLAPIHVVDAAGNNPVPPYSSWATAATNIQDAIDAATDGDFVVVTNGLYATGGKVMEGSLTNRVALTKPLIVASVNGAVATIIQGARDPGTGGNGPLAVRCAWLTNGATLSGFTLQKGATQPGNGFVGASQASGGGVWCSSTNGIVSNCVLTNNSAIYGGGISYGTLNNSLVVNNLATYGGGAYSAGLNNCTVLYNFATTSSFRCGGGTYNGSTRNSIVLYNYGNNGLTEDNYSSMIGSALYSYCCTSTNWSKTGTGNISADPQFLDLFHIAATSPCYGAGSRLYSTGTDMDSEPWNNPPSIGCDEVVASNLVGALSVALIGPTNLVSSGTLIRSWSFEGRITGHASRVEWSFGDGPTVTNAGYKVSHQWTNNGDYTITFTAYNTDNPGGVSTSLQVHVLPVMPPQLQSVGMASNAFQLQFMGQAETICYVQVATNLTPPVYWQALRTIYSYTEGVCQFSDFGAVSNATRFYRVQVE